MNIPTGMRAPRLTAELIDRYTQPGLWDGRLTDGYLKHWAEVDPSRVAVVDRQGSWSYGTLDSLVNSCARALRRMGIGPGDVVSWQLPNWVEAVVVHHAAVRLGAVSNPIVPIYRQREVGFILEQARSKVFVVPQSFRGFAFDEMCSALAPTLPLLQHTLFVGDDGTGSFWQALEAESGSSLESVGDANDVCVLLYTSGTTADPKGALHTHNTLDYENRSIIELFDLSGSDVVFMPSPAAHITGVLYGLQLPLVLGTSVVLMDVWNPAGGLALIERWGCSFILAATPFLRGMVDHPALAATDVSSLRVFACGGADVPPDLVTAATEALDCHVARVYGSTEFPTATCSGQGTPLAKCARTDGRAIGRAEIMLSPDHDEGDAPALSGELLVRGPELFLGYLDSTLNQAAFRDDGWFATGDLAQIDEDGFLTITGRKKDIIIRGGENISAKEVEDELYGHPNVKDVAVVGYPDPILTERVAAVVISCDGTEIGKRDVLEWLRARGIAMQKIPERVLTVTEIPRTASGKIQKFKLRELVASEIPCDRPTLRADHADQSAGLPEVKRT